MSKIILFLYSEVGPYNIPVFKELVNSYDCKVHVVRWDKNLLKPIININYNGVTFYNRSDYGFKELDLLINTLKPHLIYISGWMDTTYLTVSLPYKKSGTPVVFGFDDVWIGSLRQVFGSLYFRLFYSKYCSHAWVAGEMQYEYARRLGFNHRSIIFDLLSADTSVFKNSKYNSNATNFLYVGNFREVKGTKLLIESFKEYKKTYNGKWNLICIGNGTLASELDCIDGIKVYDYMDQISLLNIIKNCGCFILPSKHDQWGVVVHEMITASLPIILSQGVGSKTKFLIEDFNGYSFVNGDFYDLAFKMNLISTFSKNKLDLFSRNSKSLSSRISPQSSAANLMAVLNGQ